MMFGGPAEPSIWVWLAPILAFCGTLLLFGGSMITLWRTNKAADRRAKEARDMERERDGLLWRRDTLLRISEEIVDAAMGANEIYYSILTEGYNEEAKPMETVDHHVRRIHTYLLRLRLIDAEGPAESCSALHTALNRSGLGKLITDAIEHERESMEAQLYGQAEEHEAKRAEYLEKIKVHVKEIDRARVAFLDSVKDELGQVALVKSQPAK